LKAYINAPFVDALGDFEGIKDKQFQIWKGLKWATLQCDEVIEWLKATNGHAIQNVI
jgi:hypothetical protein